jgi:hypothetical protein
MRFTSAWLVVVMVAALAVPRPLSAQATENVWRSFAEKVDVGTELQVRLASGQRFRATLIEARDEAVLMLPKTRVPVPVQPIPYGQIVALERTKHGTGAGKAAAIGVGTGAATVFAILALLFATLDD